MSIVNIDLIVIQIVHIGIDIFHNIFFVTGKQVFSINCKYISDNSERIVETISRNILIGEATIFYNKEYHAKWLRALGIKFETKL